MTDHGKTAAENKKKTIINEERMNKATTALSLLGETMQTRHDIEAVVAEARKQGGSPAFVEGIKKFLSALQDRTIAPEHVKETLQREVEKIREEPRQGHLFPKEEAVTIPELERGEAAQRSELEGGPEKKRPGRDR